MKAKHLINFAEIVNGDDIKLRRALILAISCHYQPLVKPILPDAISFFKRLELDRLDTTDGVSDLLQT